MITPRPRPDGRTAPPLSRFERFMRWCGWIKAERHEAEIAFTISAVVTAEEIDRLRSAQMEKTQELYEFVAARWNEDRAKWLNEDVAARHQRDCDVIILAQAFMSAVDSSPNTKSMTADLASLADRLRSSLRDWKP